MLPPGVFLREKERDLTQSYDKSPYTDRKIQKATWQDKNATKNFDYTTIADRLRTVSWGNDSHPTGVFKPVYGIPSFLFHRYDELNYNLFDATSVTTILIGTTRKTRQRKVTAEQCEKYAEHLGLPYFEVDIDDDSQIEYIFKILANTYVQSYKCRTSLSLSTNALSTDSSKSGDVIVRMMNQAKVSYSAMLCSW